MGRIDIKEKETDIQNTICEYLEKKGRCFWRSNNIPAFNREEGGQIRMRRLPKYTPKGLPDINVIVAGKYWGLEVKKKDGRQSPDQKEMEERIKSHYGEYHVVRSVEDVQVLGL